jgi:hypothetical protein
MPLFRREKLHERLARIAGIDAEPAVDTPIDPRPRWSEVGIHGVPRPREWDGVATVDAPELRGDALQFATLEDGTLLEEENPIEQDLTVLADAVEETVEPPYRAQAVRRHGATWVVGTRRLRLVDIPEAPGNDITVTLLNGTHELVVDRERGFGSVPALEKLGAGHSSYVLEAKHLDGDTFEYRLTVL